MSQASSDPAAAARAVIRRRRERRHELLDLAAQFAEGLAADLGVRAVVVYGSVARGDFNVWSDIDVLVIADKLPERLPDRLAALGDHAPPGIQAVGWTPEELARQAKRRNPIAVEALERGVVISGPDALEKLIDEATAS